MSKQDFNYNAQDRQIRIVHDEQLDEVQTLLEGWGFTTVETGRTPTGLSRTERNFATMQLPENWKVWGGFDPEEATTIADDKNALRLTVHHMSVPMPDSGMVRELFSVSFHDRFSLSPVIDRERRDVSKEFSNLKDNLTGESFQISPAIDLLLDFDGVWERTMAEKFNVSAGKDLTSQIARAALWNKTYGLDKHDVEDIRIIALGKHYDSEIAKLEREHAALVEKKENLPPRSQRGMWWNFK